MPIMKTQNITLWGVAEIIEIINGYLPLAAELS